MKKRIIIFVFFFFLVNLYAFDIKKPTSIDYFIGYGQGKLESQPDYKFPIFGVNFSYPLSSVWNFQLEPFASYVYKPEDNFEVGIAFFFKYNFLNSKKISPYIKGGSGIIYISQDTHEQSTHFNFVDQICGGVEFEIKKSTFFIEYRYRHISNAGIDHPNSGINSNIYLIGFSYPF